MKRTIKFRGRIVKDHVEKWKRGKIVYGSLMVFDDEDGCTHWIIDENIKPYRNYPVEPDSVAQLVGVDRNGNEVYEGDKIVSIHGVTSTATFLGNLLDGDRLLESVTLKD